MLQINSNSSPKQFQDPLKTDPDAWKTNRNIYLFQSLLSKNKWNPLREFFTKKRDQKYPQWTISTTKTMTGHCQLATCFLFSHRCITHEAGAGAERTHSRRPGRWHLPVLCLPYSFGGQHVQAWLLQKTCALIRPSWSMTHTYSRWTMPEALFWPVRKPANLVTPKNTVVVSIALGGGAGHILNVHSEPLGNS